MLKLNNINKQGVGKLESKTFEATNKADAGRRLAEIEKELSNYGNNFNIKKFVPLVLCLEDAVNSCEIQIIKKEYCDKAFEKNPVCLTILYQVIVEYFESLNYILAEIINKGFYDKSTKIQLAETNFTVIIGKDYKEQLADLIRHLIEIGEVSKKPHVFGERRLFNCRFPGVVGFIFSNISEQTRKNLDRLLGYKDLLYQKGLLMSMIYRAPEGTKLVIDENGMDVKYPQGFSVERELEKVGITPRAIETHSQACDWNSSFKTIANETAKVAQTEGKGKSNLKRLENEDKELFNAYSLMPNFETTFERSYFVQMEVFFKILNQLMIFSYHQTHTVGIWSLPDLLRKLACSNISDVQALTVLNLLGNRSKHSLHCQGLIILGNELVLTNFRRLCNSKIALLEYCFDEAYDKDLKGKVFEGACRKMLKAKEVFVLPSRVDIPQPVLPDEISSRLFGKQKSKTDFDVVASFDNTLLLLECKEIKYSSTRLKVSEQNLFKKFSIEHYYRAKWVSSNLSKLKDYMGIENWNILNLDEQSPVNVLPLLVSNILVKIPSDEGTPLLTFAEFQEALNNKESLKPKDANFSEVEIKINGRRIILPCFSGSYC